MKYDNRVVEASTDNDAGFGPYFKSGIYEPYYVELEKGDHIFSRVFSEMFFYTNQNVLLNSENKTCVNI